MQGRNKTKYPGVYYKNTKNNVTGKEERIYYIQYRTPDGKQHHEKIGTTAMGLTDARANTIRTERMSGREMTNTARRRKEEAEKDTERNLWTIEKLWDDLKNNHQTKSGKKTDNNRFKKHIAPVFGDREPNTITILEVRRLRNKLEKIHAAQTVKHVLSLLQRIINHGISYHHLPPLGFRIEMPKVDNEKTEDLTPQQLKNLLAAIEEDHDEQAKNLMKMAMFTGMRRGELFNLRWEDINFDRNTILIREPKGGKSQNIPMNQSAREILLTHESSHPNSAYVFPGRYGGKRTDIKRPVNRIKKRAGLPDDFRPLHGLRHVYASTLASSGRVDIYTLQKLLTHKSPKMTQRYAHLRDETLKKASEVAVDAINEILGGKAKVEGRN